MLRSLHILLCTIFLLPCLLVAPPPTYDISFAGESPQGKTFQFEKTYEVREVKPGLSYVYMYDFVDNLDLIANGVQALKSQVQRSSIWDRIDGIVVPGDKANVLGASFTNALSLDKPGLFFQVFRGSAKGGSIRHVIYKPITHAKDKELHMRPDQAAVILGKSVLILDDILSTGATLQATKELVESAGGSVLGFSVLATEGNKREEKRFLSLPLFSLFHLPLFSD